MKIFLLLVFAISATCAFTQPINDTEKQLLTYIDTWERRPYNGRGC